MAAHTKRFGILLTGVLLSQTVLVSASDHHSAQSSLFRHSDNARTVSNTSRSKGQRTTDQADGARNGEGQRSRFKNQHPSDDRQDLGGSQQGSSHRIRRYGGSNRIPSTESRTPQTENTDAVGSGGANSTASEVSDPGQLENGSTTSSVSLEKEMLQLINQARSVARQCGSKTYPARPPVSWNKQLEAAAALHSDDMASHNFLSHTGSDGLDVSDRVSSEGYAWRSVGENIAAGYETAKAAVNGWLSSPGHCTNIMDSTFSEIGGALSEDSNSDYKLYWTLVLAKQ